MIKHFNAKIYGRVQGVFFRYSAKIKAEELGIKGLARNEPDGSVCIEAEGKDEDLEKFIEWCRNGPNMARVDKVEVEEGSVKRYNGFDVE